MISGFGSSRRAACANQTSFGTRSEGPISGEGPTVVNFHTTMPSSTCVTIKKEFESGVGLIRATFIGYAWGGSLSNDPEYPVIERQKHVIVDFGIWKLSNIWAVSLLPTVYLLLLVLITN